MPPTDINEAGWWSFYSNQILIRRATSKTIPCNHDFNFNHQQRATVSSGDWDQDAIQLVSGFRHVIAVIKLEGLLPVDIWSAKTYVDTCRPWKEEKQDTETRYNTLVVLCKRVATNIDLVIEHLLMGGQNPAIWQTAMVSVKLQPFKPMKT